MNGGARVLSKRLGVVRSSAFGYEGYCSWRNVGGRRNRYEWLR